jgi:hypothetical protein
MKNILIAISFVVLFAKCQSPTKEPNVSYNLSLEVAMYDSVQVFVNNVKNEISPSIYVINFDSKKNDTISYELTTIHNNEAIDSKYKDYLYFRNRDRSLLIVQPNNYLQFCSPVAANKLRYLKGISFTDTPVSRVYDPPLIGLITVRNKVFVDYHFMPEKMRSMERPPIAFKPPRILHRHPLFRHNHKN